ncbi:MAG: Peptidoglycan-binding LysM [Acidimicrobiaceae bacterium]|nr:Peptidoglycan-binding LysM [Acidimicrobiaceae bacterium]
MNTSARRTGELLRGLLALVALVLLVAGLPVALVFLGQTTSTGQAISVSRLTGPDDGTLFLTAVVAIAWAAWLVLVVCLLLEISGLVRGLPTPRLPALGAAQQTVAALVAAVTVLLSSGGGGQLVVKPMGATAVVTTSAEPAPALAVVAVVEAAPELPQIEVRRHDTLWSLAERHLGSGERWQQIFDLNRGVTQADGRHLTSARWIYPGWQLRLPADAAQITGATPRGLHVVKAGETLSEIAQAELGSADGASALFAANEGRPQIGGGALHTPDLIQPGWQLVLPSSGAATGRPSEPARVAPPIPEPAPVMPLGPSVPEPVVAEHTPAQVRGAEAEGDSAVREDLVGLGLGALTATGLLLEVRRRRRLQQRSRSAGSRIPMPEHEVADLERHVAALESPQSIASTRTALRALAQSCAERGRPLPDVLLVRVGQRSLRLELATDDADAVPPFSAAPSAGIWTLTSEPGPFDADDPYPALVALGSADDEMLLLNLESIGALHLVDAAGDVRRALLADLAVGPFAAGAPLTLVGCFQEVPAALEPGRARVVSTVEQAHREATVRVREQADQLASTGDVRSSRTATGAGESLPPEVYVADEALSPAPKPWSGVCVIDQHWAGEGWSLTVEQSGQARLEPLGLDLEPQKLGEEEFARILDLLRTGGRATETSPSGTPVGTCRAVAAALPDVPSTQMDLRPDAPAPPRVLLLGRVDVENAIDEAAPHRRRRASELVAYLALHPGASGGELDEALWPGRRVEKTTRNPFVSRARQWLGRNADGEPYLPLVADGGSYRLRAEVSCDWHDFVRFAELGLETNPPNPSALSAALDLVRGRPFLGVDPTTYTWAESDTQEMISAVVDVAHALAELRLEEGDLRGAREAVAKGLLAEPCSEMLFQDAMKAAIAAGDHAEVERLAARLRHEIELVDPDESLDDTTLALLDTARGPFAAETLRSDVRVAVR